MSHLFDDAKSVKGISVFENDLIELISYDESFSPVWYDYDSTGLLILKGYRSFFCKLDHCGSPITSVAMERGMKKYEVIGLTYTGGAVTEGLELDKEFILDWILRIKKVKVQSFKS